MSHTPGPWSISEVPCGPGRDGYAAIDAKDRWYALAEVVVVFEGEDFEPGRANARLIAAAPDMYAAIRAYLDAGSEEADIAAYRMLVAAIAKAEGK